MNKLLLVDDDQDDIYLVQKALNECVVPVSVHALPHDVSCAQLLDEARHGRRTLILLDVNMPDRDGMDLLRELRAAPNGRSSIICMLSAHGDAGVVGRAYELGANAFVVKPRSLRAYREAFERLVLFWFGAACLPNGIASTEAL